MFFVRNLLVLGLLLALTCPVLAQSPSTAAVPVVTFESNWPQADPAWYSISIAADGSSSYRSQAQLAANQQADDPYVVNFIASENTRKRIFDLAKTLNYFHSDFEFHGGNIAQTGKKTLRYRNGEQSSETTLNFSANTDVMDLVSMFQKISATVEFGRRIEYKLRFDKLGLDSELKAMESMSQRGSLLEVQTVEPILRRALADRGTMNISRQRIQHILGQNGSSK